MIDLFQTWQIVCIPLTVMIISQTVKVVLETVKNGKFEWKHFNSYGGMPSSHTAMFVSASMIIGLVEGFSSTFFAIIFFLTVVLVRDAVGIRWSLGTHGRVLNHLIETLPKNVQKQFPKQLEERLGHTNREVFAGALFGIVLTTMFYIILN